MLYLHNIVVQNGAVLGNGMILDCKYEPHMVEDVTFFKHEVTVMHFLEALERELDFQHEYEKLERMVVEEKVNIEYVNSTSINDAIEKEFRSWKKRKSYLSFEEVRTELGFDYYYDYGRYFFTSEVGIKEYFLYCEMILNLIFDLNIHQDFHFSQKIKIITDTIKYVIDKSGFELKRCNDELLIVEKNAAALEVADLVPNLADVIIEYNHYLLKGNIDRKKELLKKIVDAIEPERKIFESISYQETDDFFNLVNNMNIRHNNCDPNYKSRYCEAFATLSDNEKEKWYDLLYDQALFLYVKKAQIDRNKRIAEFKKIMH